MRTWLKRLVLLTASVAVTIGLLEVGFRIAGYEPLYNVYSQPEAFWERDALLGWALSPGARGEYVGPRPFPIQYRTDIRINELGLRGPEVDPIPEKASRVLVLGDSMTAGFEVPEGQTYSMVAEQRLRTLASRPVEVVNGGVRGYGTDQSYLLYRERLRELHPDVVVYHTTSNDAEDNTTLHRARRPFAKPAFVPRSSGGLNLVGYPIPEYPLCSSYRLNQRYRVTRMDTWRTRALCWLQTRLADHSALFSFISTRLAQNPSLLSRIYDLGTPEGQRRGGASTGIDYAHRLTSLIIRRFVNTVVHDGALFVLMGQRSDVSRLGLDTRQDREMELLYLDDALGPNPGEEVRFPVDGHYNEKGHALVGRLLADRLARMLT